MANVDLKTGVITGAEKGTKTYYHEQGHLVFEKENPNGNNIRIWQELSIKFLIFCMAFYILYPNTILKMFILILIFLSITTELIEEAWCWKYAQIKMGKMSDDSEEIS
jgi:hypothetical protein